MCSIILLSQWEYCSSSLWSQARRDFLIGWRSGKELPSRTYQQVCAYTIQNQVPTRTWWRLILQLFGSSAQLNILWSLGMECSKYWLHQLAGCVLGQFFHVFLDKYSQYGGASHGGELIIDPKHFDTNISVHLFEDSDCVAFGSIPIRSLVGSTSNGLVLRFNNFGQAIASLWDIIHRIINNSGQPNQSILLYYQLVNEMLLEWLTTTKRVQFSGEQNTSLISLGPGTSVCLWFDNFRWVRGAHVCHKRSSH